MKPILRLFQIIILLIFIHSSSIAQSGPNPVTKSEQQQVIDSIAKLLNDNYIFPETAKKMNDLIIANFKKGNYANITNPAEFADKLTSDLQSISKDKHLRVGFNPEFVKEMRGRTQSDDEEIPQAWLDEMRKGNFGFNEVKILDGNIGYLDLRGFVDARFGGETAVAAMNFLSNADALIIDLRKNGGGSPSMIQLISSYLFGSESVHLNNFYYRPADRHTQTWTLPHVSGKRRPDIDVYVLTSNRTFSAAEEFTYNLKNLKRATIVGETTGGGAHPGGTRVATERFTVWVPTGRAINPITKTNWEGTGVSPDISTNASDALNTAQQEAFKKLMAKSPADKKAFYEWKLVSLTAKSKPVVIDDATMRSYAGTYGPRVITFENGTLMYQRGTNPKGRLIPLEKDLFELEDAPYFRVKFIVENNRVVALEGRYDDGRTDRNPKQAGF